MVGLLDGPACQGQDIEEHTLVASLRAGDNDAYEYLVRTYGGRMLAVAIGVLRNRIVAKQK